MKIRPLRPDPESRNQAENLTGSALQFQQQPFEFVHSVFLVRQKLV